MNASDPQDQPAIQSLKVYMTERRRIVAQVRRQGLGTPVNREGPGSSGEPSDQSAGEPGPGGLRKKNRRMRRFSDKRR